MSIIRTFLSVVIVNAAVFVITLSFMAWVVDATLLDSTQLTKSFDKFKVAGAIAEAIPHMATPDKGTGPDGKPVEARDPLEIQRVQDTIRQVADEPYVRTKINGLVTNVIGFIKTGQPRPTIDLTDFSARVQQSQIGELPADFSEKLSKPIDIAENSDNQAFTSIRQSYNLLKIFKIAGPIIAAVLLILEWLLTPQGKKLGKLAWVAIAAGLWGVFWWFVISAAPNFIATRVNADAAAEKALINVVNALLKSLADLLSGRFLQFGIICLVIGANILLLRFVLGKRNKLAVAPAAPAPTTKIAVRK